MNPFRLLIINDYGIFGGGTENRIRNFVDEILKNKIPLQTYNVTEIHILQRFSHSEEKLYQGNNIFFHTAKNSLHAYILAKEIIRKYNISFIQIHHLLALQPYVLFAAKQAKVPVVWWAHDYWLLCAKRSFIDPFHATKENLCDKAYGKTCNRCMPFRTQFKHFLWKKIVNSCDHAIAPSHILQYIHEKNHVLNGKWSVITPWIDPSYILLEKEQRTRDNANFKKKKEKKKKRMLLYVGSLIEFKGAWVAARALKKIIQRFPDTQLFFVGSDQEPGSRYRKDIEELCRRDGTLQNIFFLGKKEKEELTILYVQADIFLCPTVCMESFGLTWAEAMIAGCSIVASAIGSIPEYIQDKKTGLLFPPRDHDALASAVITLFNDTAFAKRLGKNGQIYAQKQFAAKRAAIEVMALYTSLAEKRKFYDHK